MILPPDPDFSNIEEICVAKEVLWYCQGKGFRGSHNNKPRIKCMRAICDHVIGTW